MGYLGEMSINYIKVNNILLKSPRFDTATVTLYNIILAVDV